MCFSCELIFVNPILQNIHDTIQFTYDVVQGKVTISEKENEFVYHEKVPELSAITSEIKGVSLVKGIPFKFDDPQIAGKTIFSDYVFINSSSTVHNMIISFIHSLYICQGPDIFGRLVPIEAHEVSSLYRLVFFSLTSIFEMNVFSHICCMHENVCFI